MAGPKLQTELTIENLRASFAREDQGHVFAHWDCLDDGSRDALFSQAARLAPNLPALAAAYRAARASSHGGTQPIEPAPAIELPVADADVARAEAAHKRGEEILAEGRLGVFLVAGGQGTRLGFPHPKGCLPFGPITDRTLFELQAQKIRGVARRAGRPIPWYVMTSDATDAETREAFERNDSFGLDPADVMIFRQEMVPAFDFEGRLILAAPDRIFESPNGHGGALTALGSSGALDDMDRRGIDTLFFYQVDNPLVKIGDPTYLGLHAEAGAEMSCKVVRKVDPMEKVGIVARVGADIGVVEYTELGDAERYALDSDGGLRFWAGNVAIHLLATDLVRRVASQAFDLLPFHVSAKKIPTIDAEGRPVEPAEPNGFKLERFVFDALGAARGVCVVETTAAEEFSPIKNAEGKDSPESCRRDLVALYRSWLGAGGVDVPPDTEVIEIDHAIIDGPRDAAAAGYASAAEAGDGIRTAGGRNA